MTLAKRCQAIELFLADVDGVLTDGSITFNNEGIETKSFHIRDGLGIQLWRAAGGKFGLITGRNSHIVNVRAAELGVDLVRQGVHDKLAALREILAELHLKPEQVCFVGDDLPDLPAIQFAGLGVTVADGCEDVKRVADHVTTLAGGKGAVREVVELVLKHQKRWEYLIQKYHA